MPEAHRPNDEAKFTSVDLLERPEKKLEVEDFDAQASDIAYTIANHKNGHMEGRREAYREYVENEDNSDLRYFGKLMILAEGMALDDRRLDELESKKLVAHRHGEDLPRDEADELAKLKRRECSYIQKLEHIVEENEEAMPLARLESWLSRASADHRWAKNRVSGIRGEIAAHKLLSVMPGINNLNHGDVDDDLAGKDFVFDETPQGISSIDVKKSGRSAELPVTAGKHKGGLILSIDADHLVPGKSDIKEEFKSAYIGELEKHL